MVSTAIATSRSRSFLKARAPSSKRKAILLDEIAFLKPYKMVAINCVQAGSDKGLGKRWRGFLDELARAHDGVSVRE